MQNCGKAPYFIIGSTHSSEAPLDAESIKSKGARPCLGRNACVSAEAWVKKWDVLLGVVETMTEEAKSNVVRGGWRWIDEHSSNIVAP